MICDKCVSHELSEDPQQLLEARSLDKGLFGFSVYACATAINPAVALTGMCVQTFADRLVKYPKNNDRRLNSCMHHCCIF